jgi:hypothetical protein
VRLLAPMGSCRWTILILCSATLPTYCASSQIAPTAQCVAQVLPWHRNDLSRRVSTRRDWLCLRTTQPALRCHRAERRCRSEGVAPTHMRTDALAIDLLGPARAPSFGAAAFGSRRGPRGRKELWSRVRIRPVRLILDARETRGSTGTRPRAQAYSPDDSGDLRAHEDPANFAGCWRRRECQRALKRVDSQLACFCMTRLASVASSSGQRLSLAQPGVVT